MNNPAPVLVGIIGPLTDGTGKVDLAHYHRALDAAEELSALEASCYIPHLNCEWHYDYAHTEDFWISQSLSVLSRCDFIFKLPGESAGTRKEEAHLRSMGLPITMSMTCANALIKATTELRRATGRSFLNLPYGVKTKLCNELDAMSFLFFYHQNARKENSLIREESPVAQQTPDPNQSPVPSEGDKASPEYSDLPEGEEKEKELQS